MLRGVDYWVITNKASMFIQLFYDKKALRLNRPRLTPFLISGLLTSIRKTSREALISIEPTKFGVKTSVNLRHISRSEFRHCIRIETKAAAEHLVLQI